MKATNQAKLLRVSEVTKMLGISDQQVRAYRKKGLIRSVQFMDKGDHHYLREDIEKLLRRK